MQDDTGGAATPGNDEGGLLPFERSVGYQLRVANRLVQRYLQELIEPHGVTLGMWYYLRALWRRDGVTQSELSVLVGTMEPSTLTAVQAMERSGLVRRVRNVDDRRKINIFLTPYGRELEGKLLPLARDVVETSLIGFSMRERDMLLQFLKAVQENVGLRLGSEQHAADKSAREGSK